MSQDAKAGAPYPRGDPDEVRRLTDHAEVQLAELMAALDQLESEANGLALGIGDAGRVANIARELRDHALAMTETHLRLGAEATAVADWHAGHRAALEAYWADAPGAGYVTPADARDSLSRPINVEGTNER